MKAIYGIGLFIRQVLSELGKSVSPTLRGLVGWSFAVFLFVGLLMVMVTGMDYGLGRLVMRVFG